MPVVVVTIDVIIMLQIIILIVNKSNKFKLLHKTGIII
jgi:hypothetical protein